MTTTTERGSGQLSQEQRKRGRLTRVITREFWRSTGEGNGSPLQYSCLENPMDGGAWWATVQGVAKSQTWLSNFTGGGIHDCHRRPKSWGEVKNILLSLVPLSEYLFMASLTLATNLLYFFVTEMWQLIVTKFTYPHFQTFREGPTFLLLFQFSNWRKYS